MFSDFNVPFSDDRVTSISKNMCGIEYVSPLYFWYVISNFEIVQQAEVSKQLRAFCKTSHISIHLPTDQFCNIVIGKVSLYTPSHCKSKLGPTEVFLSARHPATYIWAITIVNTETGGPPYVKYTAVALQPTGEDNEQETYFESK